MADLDPLRMVEAFDDYDSMKDMLTNIAISNACTTWVIDEEGFETEKDLAIA